MELQSLYLLTEDISEAGNRTWHRQQSLDTAWSTKPGCTKS